MAYAQNDPATEAKVQEYNRQIEEYNRDAALRETEAERLSEQAEVQREQAQGELEEFQRRRAAEQQAELYARSPPGNPNKWLKEMRGPNSGDWFLYSGYDDGKLGVFFSRRNSMRVKGVATVWRRIEFREPKSAQGIHDYKSVVERDQYNCVARTTRSVAAVYYSENGLSGEPESFEFPNATWDAIVPGTRGDAWADWACAATAPKSSPAKPNTPKPMTPKS
jgi:hypothetical protein